jgi:hypothetical protein
VRTLWVFFFFILSFTAKGQSFFYSYIDPCSGKSKEITIPYGQNSVTVNYYGNVNTFNANDFNSGVFQLWMQNIAQSNTSNPCSSISVILTNNVNMIVTQNVISTVMNITSLTASLGDLTSDISSVTANAGNLAAALDNSESGSGKSKDKKKNGTNPNGGSSTTFNGSGDNSQTQTNNGNTNETSGSNVQMGGTSQQSSNTATAGSSTSQPSVANNSTAGGSEPSQSSGSSSSNNVGSNGTSNNSTTGSSSTNNGSSTQSGNTTGGSKTNGASNNSGQSNGQTTSGPTNGSSVSSSNLQSNSSGSSVSSSVSSSGQTQGGITNNTNVESTSSNTSVTQTATSGAANDSSASSLNVPASNSVGQNGSQSVNSGNTSTFTAPNSTSNGNINSNSIGTSTGSDNLANNTSSTKSVNSNPGLGGSGATSMALTNAEENSGDNKDGGEKKTGSMIGQGDLVVLKSADDPTAKNQVRINTSITKANTNNTRVKGVLVNYTSEVNNTNVTFYKAWVFKKSKLTLITANSSMMNFEKDFFNTTTTVISKRYKGNWRKLTTMAGINFTAGNYGTTPFLNASAIGGGFYAYKINEKVSGSLLIVGVYSPFTQFFDGRWWDSSTLIVPYSTWDYKLTKTFKLNVSFSGVYEMNKNMLNYQVLTGGKIMF